MRCDAFTLQTCLSLLMQRDFVDAMKEGSESLWLRGTCQAGPASTKEACTYTVKDTAMSIRISIKMYRPHIAGQGDGKRLLPIAESA